MQSLVIVTIHQHYYIADYLNMSEDRKKFFNVLVKFLIGE